MRLAPISAVLVLLPALAFARGDSRQQPKTDEPAELLEVASIFSYDFFGRQKCFNHGRPHLVSINQNLHGAKASRRKLARTLQEEKLLDQVVFHWFGKEPPKRLNLWLGKKIPVPIAQAVITTFATESKIPVYLTLMTTDDGLLSTQRVIVGGLIDRGKNPITPEQIKELLKPGLTNECLAELVSKLKTEPGIRYE